MIRLNYKVRVALLIIIATMILLLLCLLAIRLFHPGDEAAVGIVSIAVTLVGTIFIAVELKNGAEVTCSQMLIDLNNYFHDSDRLMGVYQALELCEADKDYSSRHWQGISSVDIAQFCTFFENLYLLYRHHIASMEDLDDLFGYRFFLFLNNPYIQENYILPTSSSYVQIFELYTVWIRYRKRYVPGSEYAFPQEYLERKWYLCDDGLERYNKEIERFEANGHSFVLRQLGFDSLQALMDLQSRIVAGLDNPDVYCPLTRDELIESIQLDYAAGVFNEQNRLVSYAILVTNRSTSRSLAKDADMASDQCFTFDAVGTDPEWRGMELQQRFIRWTERLAEEHHASTILATVAPDNTVSQANFAHQGFSTLKTITKYHGLTRLLVCKTRDKA